MKTFDYGEYGIIECLDTEKPIGFADEHGDYVFLAEAQEMIDKLSGANEELMKIPTLQRDRIEVLENEKRHLLSQVAALTAERDALRKEIAFMRSDEYLKGRWEATPKYQQDGGSVVIKPTSGRLFKKFNLKD